MDLTQGIDTLVSQIDPKTLLQGIEYRVVRTRDELEKAYSLVYREYLKRNYVTENKSQLRLSLHNALPAATTFIGIIGDEVIATATLIPDSKLGLPMDKIYHKELKQFRDIKGKICEISMLASNTELFNRNTSMMLNAKKLFFIFFLFKLIFDYATDRLKLDYICITINPKHKLTYDFLLFKDIGGLMSYKHANQAPAIAKCINLRTVEEECKKTNRKGLYKMFFLKKTNPQQLSGKFVFGDCDLKYFFVEKTDIFKNASPDELEYIGNCYAACGLSNIIP